MGYSSNRSEDCNSVTHCADSVNLNCNPVERGRHGFAGSLPPRDGRGRFAPGLQVVELYKCNAGTHRTDDDILASHHLQIIGKFYRAPDGGGSENVGQLLAQRFNRVALALDVSC
jgi:hypothetical protein